MSIIISLQLATNIFFYLRLSISRYIISFFLFSHSRILTYWNIWSFPFGRCFLGFYKSSNSKLSLEKKQETTGSYFLGRKKKKRNRSKYPRPEAQGPRPKAQWNSSPSSIKARPFVQILPYKLHFVHVGEGTPFFTENRGRASTCTRKRNDLRDFDSFFVWGFRCRS